jgi:maleate cis-trans isomerase
VKISQSHQKRDYTSLGFCIYESRKLKNDLTHSYFFYPSLTYQLTPMPSFIKPWYQLGYIIPHLYTDQDAYQFYRVAPDGMMLVTTGLNLREYSLAAVEENLPTLWERFNLLAQKKVDRISLSGVPVASALGRPKMLEILQEAEARTGLVCDTDLEAHIAALKALGATQIALATRWPEAINQMLTRYLALADIHVLGCCSRSRSLDQNKGANASDDHELALELGRQALQQFPQAQALLMPGGLWYAIYAAPQLESEFGKPVLLNILSTTWAALQSASQPLVQRPQNHWGMLLSRL